jgi:DUF4097 and DUF4098 domain-containing protein YvlB
MKHAITVIATVAAMTAALAAPSSATEREEINQVYQVGKNARLSLSNLNGAATISGWDKYTIEVKATKTTSGSRERLDDVTVNFDMKNDHLRIDVDYDDSEHWHDGGVGVSFEIHVPHSIEIKDIKLVNGDLEVSDVTGDVSASSVNGEVTGDQLGGEVHLSTVNGDVSLKSVVGHDSIELSSVNGSVDISLPRKVNAKVSASTIHGDVHGELAHGVTHAGSSMDAVLGNGGMRIELSTVNGDIRIRRDGSGARADDDSEDDSD